MKRLLLVLGVVLCSCGAAFAQKVKVLGTAEQSQSVVTSGVSSTTKAERTFPGATITIYSPTGTTTIANIFSNATGTVKANPFTANSLAIYDFFIDPETVFDVRISGTGVTTPFTRAGYTAPGMGVTGITILSCGGINDSVALLTAIAGGGTLVIPSGVTCVADSTVIFPATVRLQISLGGILSPLTGETIKIRGPFEAGSYPVFTNALAAQGTISFDGNNAGQLFELRAIWWGLPTTGFPGLAALGAATSVTATLNSPHVRVVAPLDINKGGSFTVLPSNSPFEQSAGEISLQGGTWRSSLTSRYLKGISSNPVLSGTASLTGTLFCPGDATDPTCLNRLVGVEAYALIDDNAQVPWAMGMVSVVAAFNSATAAPNVAALYADVSLSNTAVNAYGILITASNSASATNAYGVKISNVASTTNPFGFYSAGTWPNFFGGPLQLGGSASGTVTVKTAAAAGTWSLTLPTTAGTAGGVLTTDGTGITTWTGGAVSGWTDDGTVVRLTTVTDNVGIGTTNPIFNDDAVPIGKWVAIDGGASGNAAYLGIGGTVPGINDRIGMLGFYNLITGGVDHRQAAIFSFNEGSVQQGNLIFYTAPNLNGPQPRLSISHTGEVGINHTASQSSSVTLQLAGQGFTSASYSLVILNSIDTPYAFFRDNGKAYIATTDPNSIVAPESNNSFFVGQAGQFSVNTTGDSLQRSIQLVGGTEPTCNLAARGTIWIVPGGAGVKDAVEVCAKDAADAYAWRAIY